jgi:hypothetical protein
MAVWTRCVGLFTFALVAVGIVTAYIFGRQLNVMQGQLDEEKAKTILTRTQLRANLRLEVPTITPFGAGQVLAGTKEQSSGWAVSPTWINVGGSDARDYMGWFDIRIFDVRSPKHLTGADCPSLAQPDPLPDGIIIHPGTQIAQLAKTLSVEDVVGAKNETKYILMYGHIEYRDVFPDSSLHHEDWCMVVVPNNIEHGVFSLPTLRDKAD